MNGNFVKNVIIAFLFIVFYLICSQSKIYCNELDIKKQIIDIYNDSLEYVDVKKYGAVGDGVHDETGAIYKAIEHIKNVGGVLFFPSGIYKTNRTFHINFRFLNIKGAGKENTKINYTGTGASFQFAFPSSDPSQYVDSCQDVSIEDISIEGNGNGIAILDYQNGGFFLKNVRINSFSTGFKGITSDINNFTEVTFSNCTIGCDLYVRSDQQFFNNCMFHNNEIGLKVEYNRGGNIIGGVFVANKVDIKFTAPDHPSYGNETIQDCSWSINGTWFESMNLKGNKTKHIVFGEGGNSSRYLKRITINNVYLLASFSDYFLDIFAGDEVVINNLYMEGAVKRLININKIPGLTQYVKTVDLGLPGGTIVNDSAFSGNVVQFYTIYNGGQFGQVLKSSSPQLRLIDSNGQDIKMVNDFDAFTIQRNKGTETVPNWENTLVYGILNKYLSGVNAYWLSDINASIRGGKGEPEGKISANPGSIFLRTDGTENNALYFKITGTGSSGWKSLSNKIEWGKSSPTSIWVADSAGGKAEKQLKVRTLVIDGVNVNVLTGD